METQETSDEIIQRHKKEKKELQGKIQALKKTATKGDKKKKKEVAEEITHLESEMEKKHQEELLEISSDNANVTTVTDELNNLHVDEDDEVPGLTQHRISKAQKRRDKKATQLKQRELSIAEQQVQNLHGVRNVEIQAIKKILKGRNLMVHEIPSDGDCLYCAVEHQLKILDSLSAPTLSELRVMTSEFLREHSVDFLPYLSHPDTGEILTEQQFQEYCDQVANTPAWGGQVELRALSHVLRCCIEVIQATAPPVIVGEEYTSGHKLILIYHRHMYGLGEHYNSVKPYEEEEEDNEFNELVNGETSPL